MAQPKIREYASIEYPPMSEREIEFLTDLQSFIDFTVRNGWGFHSVMASLGHDVNGLYRYGFDIDAAERDGFAMKVAGSSGLDEDAVGEAAVSK